MDRVTSVGSDGRATILPHPAVTIAPTVDPLGVPQDVAPGSEARTPPRVGPVSLTPLTYVLTMKACRSPHVAEVPTMAQVRELLDDIAAEVATGSYVDCKGRVQVRMPPAQKHAVCAHIDVLRCVRHLECRGERR